jgi:hypothetical protein
MGRSVAVVRVHAVTALARCDPSPDSNALFATDWSNYGQPAIPTTHDPLQP